MVYEWCADQPSLRLPILCAFLRSDYLYGHGLDMLFEDADVADFVRAKFQRLSETPLVVDNDMLCSQEKGQQDSPFPFPHADLDVYARKAYVGGSSGIAVGSIGGCDEVPGHHQGRTNVGCAGTSGRCGMGFACRGCRRRRTIRGTTLQRKLVGIKDSAILRSHPDQCLVLRGLQLGLLVDLRIKSGWRFLGNLPDRRVI